MTTPTSPTYSRTSGYSSILKDTRLQMGFLHSTGSGSSFRRLHGFSPSHVHPYETLAYPAALLCNLVQVKGGESVHSNTMTMTMQKSWNTSDLNSPGVLFNAGLVTPRPCMLDILSSLDSRWQSQPVLATYRYTNCTS